MASTGSLYNHSRITRQMLRRHRRSPASIYLHLHPAWIKFEDAKGRLILEEPITAGLEGGMAVAGPSRLGEDGGPAVLTPGKELLRCIRDQQLPNYMLDLLDARRIPFYEGCLIVEIKDHRQGPSAPGQAGREQTGLDPHINPKSLAARIEGGRYGKGPAYLAAEKARMDSLANGAAGGAGATGAASSPLARGPETYRVVLHPTEETLWTELRTLNDKLSGGTWSEEEGLEIESKILNLTSPPLCLTPDPHATRIANIMLATTAPTSRYAPLRPLPHQKTLPPMQPRKVLAGDGEASSANDEEAQRLLVEKRKREAVMRMMAGSWRMYVKDQKSQARTAQAQLPSSSASVAPVSGERPFTPTFSRLNFIERYRAKANGTAVGPVPGEGEATVDSTRDSGAAAANGQDGKAAAASTSTTTKKASTTKKRKKQEGSATPGAEDKEAPAPKGKKKKTAAAAAAAASPTSPADSTAGSPKAATKAKGATKKKAVAKKGAGADDAPTPAGDAASPAESTADTSMTGKGAKKTTTKKAAAPKGKKAQAAAAAAAAAAAQQQQQQSGSRQSTATPALHHAQLPASSPPRHAGASPFPHPAAAGIATPSPAMSHHGVSPAANGGNNGGQNFANLPFGAPQHHQQQQQQQAAAAAQIAAHFNLPLGVGMPPGLQGPGQQQGQGQMAGAGGGMGLPFATPPQQQQQAQPPQQIPQQQQAQMSNNNNNMMGGNPMGSTGFGGLNAHNAAQVAQQLQQHPNFGQLPPAVQQQVLQWQASQRQQQQQQQMGGQGGPQGQQQGGQGQGGGMLPSGWPMAQR